MTDKTGNGRIVMAEAFRHLDPNQQLGEGITAGFSRIGIKGKNWALFHEGVKYMFVRDDDGSPLPYLDCIIVGVNPKVSKMYYEGVYQEDATEAPVCTAIDGVKPDPGVPEPQAASCAVCPHNEWLPNRQGKECQDHKKVAVLLLPYMKTSPLMEAPLLQPVYFKVPPASLKVFKAYGEALSHRGAHFAGVVTRITFEPGKQFQMNFAFKQPLTNAEAPLVLPLMEDPQTRTLIGTAPIVQQLGPPELPKKEEGPQETGLMAAFGKSGTETAQLPAAPRRRGRPAKVAEAEAPASQLKEAPPEQQQGNGGYEETDSAVDSSLKEVLGKRLSDMM